MVRKSDLKLQMIQSDGHQIFSKVPFEINLTSNFYLLHNPSTTHGSNSKHVMRYFIDCNFPVLLSTDDDGVWPLDMCSEQHLNHHSLAHEVCKAIKYNILNSGKELSKMIEDFREYSFFASNTTELAHSTTNNIVEVAKTYQQMIVLRRDIVHQLLAICNNYPNLKTLCSLYHVSNDNDPTENTSKITNQELAALSKIVACYLDDKFDIPDTIDRIIHILKRDFLQGSSNQTQFLHILAEGCHYFYISNPSAVMDDLLLQLAHVAEECKKKSITNMTLRIFLYDLGSLKDSIIEMLTLINSHNNPTNVTIQVFTKLKQAPSIPINKSKFNNIIDLDVTVDHQRYKNKKTYHNNDDQHPYFALLGFNSSAVGAIMHFLINLQANWNAIKLFDTDVASFSADMLVPFSSNKDKTQLEIESDVDENKFLLTLKAKYPKLGAICKLHHTNKIGFHQRFSKEAEDILIQLKNIRVVSTSNLQIKANYLPNQQFTKLLVRNAVLYSILPSKWCSVDERFYNTCFKDVKSYMFTILRSDNDLFWICTKITYVSSLKVLYFLSFVCILIINN